MVVRTTQKPIVIVAWIVAAQSTTSFYCVRHHLLSNASAARIFLAEDSRRQCHCRGIVMHSSSRDNNNINDNVKYDEDDDNEDDEDAEEADTSSSDDISWRVAKLRLEEANTRRFLKAKPIKLDYHTSSKWICKNYDISTKTEFMDLVSNGSLRTPYISKDPETYYGVRGQWISWDHYLGVANKQSNATNENDALSSDDDEGQQESNTIAAQRQ